MESIGLGTSQLIAIAAQLATVFVALAALALAISEGREARRQRRLSVMPVLIPAYHTLDSIEMGIETRNTGLGPAAVARLDLYVDGNLRFSNASRGQIQEWGSELGLGDQGLGFYAEFEYFGRGTIIPPGASVWLLRFPPGKVSVRALATILARAGYAISYRSLYGEPREMTCNPVLLPENHKTLLKYLGSRKVTG